MSTLWLGRLSISVGTQGRGNNGDDQPWLGFYYGSWFPKATIRQRDLGWYWLCFHGNFTWWPGGGLWFWQRWKFAHKGMTRE